MFFLILYGTIKKGRGRFFYTIVSTGLSNKTHLFDSNFHLKPPPTIPSLLLFSQLLGVGYFHLFTLSKRDHLSALPWPAQPSPSIPTTLRTSPAGRLLIEAVLK